MFTMQSKPRSRFPGNGPQLPARFGGPGESFAHGRSTDMPQKFVVLDGVKYVVDADGRTLRTKEDVQDRIAGVQHTKAQFNVPWDAELARLNALLALFPN